MKEVLTVIAIAAAGALGYYIMDLCDRFFREYARRDVKVREDGRHEERIGLPRD